ncbi:hypothetical protein GQ43DRAFT_311700, partial [Delitschia confertaspora ATCC 74209]
IAFSPDGQLVASASWDDTIRLWETATGTCRSTLATRYQYTASLAFSSDSHFLYTDQGAIPLSSPSIEVPASQIKQLSYLFVKDRWILRNEQALLWLPAEYDPSCIAVSEHIVCLGHSSGGVTFLKIK